MTYATEAEMVADWLAQLKASGAGKRWTVYAETCGWDLLLVHADGFQVGIEAKLSLNAKVLEQALSGADNYWRADGPDYRAVLVPEGKCQLHLTKIAGALGIQILTVTPLERGIIRGMGLPDESWCSRWANWLPAQRCKLPDYVPDVEGGHSAPVMLTEWKIRAIRLMIVLERRGYVTRADMKSLQISPTRWCDSWHGFLARTPAGYVRCNRTPDLKAQHPINWAQIEADIADWSKDLAPLTPAPSADLFGDVA